MVGNPQSPLPLSRLGEISVDGHQLAELLTSTPAVLLLSFDRSGRVKGKWHVASRRP